MNVLLLHGALGAAAQFQPLLNGWTDEAHLLPVDFPGHGALPASGEASLHAYAQQVIRMLEQSGPAAIFGYSMGGYVALMVAAQRPDLVTRVMTLATKFDWNAEEGKKQVSRLNPDVMEVKVPAYAAYLNSLHTARSWKDVVRDTAVVLEQLSANPPLQPDVLQRISVPCTIALGEEDTMVTREESEAAASLIPSARFELWPGVPHPLERVPTKHLSVGVNRFLS